MSYPNASTALAEVIVDELVRSGVRRVVIAPGSRSAALAIAAARSSDIDVTVVIDERSAAFFALGVAKASGIPAAVVTTSGSAIAHLFPAVIEADTACVPLLLFTADRPPELHGIGANQTIEQAGLFGTHVRAGIELGPAEHDPGAPSEWRRAVAGAVAASADGPVHVNVSFREPVVPETDDGRDRDRVFSYATDPTESADPLGPPAGMTPMTLDESWTGPERGVVVVGDSPFVEIHAADRLAARLGWPLIVEPTAGARPPQTITVAHHVLSDPELASRLAPEVAIVVGRANLSRPLGSWLSGVRRLIIDPRVTRVPDASAVLGLGWPQFDTVIRREGEWRKTWLDIEGVGRLALDGHLDDSPLTEPRLARDTADAVPPNGVLLAASSMPIRDLDMTMRVGTAPVMSNRGASGIDGLVSTGFGVASTHPGPVVALTGDLALLHDGNGFLVEPRPDVVFVVANNDGGGIFSFLPQSRQTDVFERLFGTPHGRSFEILAAFHGIGYQLVSDLPGQIRSAIAAGGTWILESVSDRQANPGIHRDLTAAVVRAVGASLER
jgi:2-succinyl-5-enolpyruvyl-6-hydroxy-3-cyclohexene-1-carboxylate synthase